jgi:hypothetical protein
MLETLAVFIVASGISYWIYYQAVKSASHTHYVGIMNVAAEKIGNTVSSMEMNAMNEFDEVEKHLDTPASVIAALESKTSLNPEVRGYFAAFEPNYFPSEGQWFEPYVHHVDDNDFEVRQVGSASHNYHKSEWYIRAKDTKESFWSDPYYYFDGTSISGHYTTFVKPIYDKTGKLACVCGADMTFEWLSKEVQQIDDDSRNNDLLNFFLLNDGGEFYTVVLNNDGSSIASPEGKPVKLTEDQMGQSLELRKSGMVETKINGKHSTVYYTPIERVNWSVAVVVTDQGIAKAMIKFGIILLLITILGMIVVWLACRRLSLD